MPIDLAQVDWLYVVVLAVFAFVATFVGNLLSFGHRGDRRRAVGGVVCRDLRGLDLLPAPLTAADRARRARRRRPPRPRRPRPPLRPPRSGRAIRSPTSRRLRTIGSVGLHPTSRIDVLSRSDRD